MGAYYKAVCTSRNECIAPMDGDVKLLSHSYFSSSYLDLVMLNIESGAWKNEPVIWACDYDDTSKYSAFYADSHSLTFEKNIVGYDYTPDDVIILNNDKKQYIDLPLYRSNHVLRQKELPIHPFPLLTNAVKEYQGGGDYDFEVKERGMWCGDRFSIIRDKHQIPNDYEDISDVCFPFNNDELIARRDKLRASSLSRSKVSLDSLPSLALNKLMHGANIRSIYDFLFFNKRCLLKFEKVNGDVVERIATLNDIGYASVFTEKRYVYFLDIDSDTLKKFKYDLFISVEAMT